MYACVGPEISKIVDSYAEVNDLRQKYPYIKCRRFDTEDECLEFTHRFANKHSLQDINHYGDTFKDLYIHMEYFIHGDVYYNFDTRQLGNIRILPTSKDVTAENRMGLTKLRMSGLSLTDDIASHLVAIYHGLKLVGPLVDVDITIPDHSIYYALCSYTGTDRTVNKVVNFIHQRQGRVSLTLGGGSIRYGKGYK